MATLLCPPHSDSSRTLQPAATKIGTKKCRRRGRSPGQASPARPPGATPGGRRTGTADHLAGSRTPTRRPPAPRTRPGAHPADRITDRATGTSRFDWVVFGPFPSVTSLASPPPCCVRRCATAARRPRPGQSGRLETLALSEDRLTRRRWRQTSRQHLRRPPSTAASLILSSGIPPTLRQHLARQHLLPPSPRRQAASCSPGSSPADRAGCVPPSCDRPGLARPRRLDAGLDCCLDV